MFNAEANAAAVSRVKRRNQERHRAAYDRVFSTPEGRSFLIELAVSCNLYDIVDTPEAEGARRVVVAIRKEAENLGLIDKWHLAENEAADFRKEMQAMLEQTETKEDTEDDFPI